MAASKDPGIRVYLPPKMLEELDRYVAEDAEDGERPNRSRFFQRLLRRERLRRRARSGGGDQAPT